MHTPPFDSIRDYVAALAERKLLMSFVNVNQDAFEGILSRLGRSEPIDELAVVGGLRGKPVDVVRTEDGNRQRPELQ